MKGKWDTVLLLQQSEKQILKCLTLDFKWDELPHNQWKIAPTGKAKLCVSVPTVNPARLPCLTEGRDFK